MQAFTPTDRTHMNRASTSKMSSSARNYSSSTAEGGARRQCLHEGPSPKIQTAAGSDQLPQTGPAFLSAMLQRREQNQHVAEVLPQHIAEHQPLLITSSQKQQELRQLHLCAQPCVPNQSSLPDAAQTFSLPLVSVQNLPLIKT